MKEKKEKCLLCDKFVMTRYEEKKGFRNKDTVRMQGDLFGKYISLVVHELCFKKYCAIGDFCG